MRLLFFFLIAHFSIAQTNSFNIHYILNDSIKNNSAAIFINHKHYKENCLEYISADSIASVNVIKGNFNLENKLYNGKIMVTTKNSYEPKFTSIKNFKENHIKQFDNNYIVCIDNKIINEDYNNVLIDENYIFKIVVEDFYDKETPIKIIKIFTKNSYKNIILK